MGIQFVVSTHAAAQVQAKGVDGVNGRLNVLGMEATCQKDGNGAGVANGLAELPVVCSACATELFDREVGVARVKEQGINQGGDGLRFTDRFLIDDVDDLNETNTWQMLA